LNLQVAPEIWTFFAHATNGDISGTTNTFSRLKWRMNQYSGSYGDLTVSTPVWQTLIEVQTAYEAFADGGIKYPLLYGDGIIDSIPPGSIYFGGTDPGRGLVTALCKSQINGDPFFTLSQNPLADARYQQYLRFMYGDRIHLPTTNEVNQAFTDYSADANRRLMHDRDFPNEPPQVQPGENLTQKNGQVQITGQISVMAINGLIAKTIFDHNPDREFYLEESFPLNWMYPYITPHNFIFKLNREPLAGLSPEIMDADHKFWTKQCDAMIGDWLRPDTSLTNVCQFVDRVYLHGDLTGFTGDPGYVNDAYATRCFSKLRSSSAGMYAWRLLQNKTDSTDKKRLIAETDFAHRQAFALCPTSPEALFRYINFLLSQGRFDDTILLMRTVRHLEPDNQQFNETMLQLLKIRDQNREKKPER
jgi:hypothetical protein